MGARASEMGDPTLNRSTTRCHSIREKKTPSRTRGPTKTALQSDASLRIDDSRQCSAGRGSPNNADPVNCELLVHSWSSYEGSDTVPCTLKCVPRCSAIQQFEMSKGHTRNIPMSICHNCSSRKLRRITFSFSRPDARRIRGCKVIFKWCPGRLGGFWKDF